ncbi:MAG: hydrogenase maturation nickel metallochaperone HypA [Chloroflexota bacterium]|nr:hydrogenase maturation nickel metallochaperone HypA [Chloroflexota bacterium]
MHETKLVHDILSLVLGEAAQGERVTRIELSLGELAGHTPEALTFHFKQAARGTAAEGASLEAVPVEVRPVCASCERSVPLGPASCPHCGGAAIVPGARDVRLEAFDLSEPVTGRVRTVRVPGGRMLQPAHVHE